MAENEAATDARPPDLVVDIVSDVVCPWCYIGKRKLETALAELQAREPGLAILRRWHPFQLNPDLPPEGIGRAAYIEAKFGGKARATEIYARVRAAGSDVGIPFDFDRIDRQPNTLDAHRLIAWAQQRGDQGATDALVERLFRAYFVEGRLLTETEQLIGVAREAGFPESEVRAMLASAAAGRMSRRKIGKRAPPVISGVPFFIFNWQDRGFPARTSLAALLGGNRRVRAPESVARIQTIRVGVCAMSVICLKTQGPVNSSSEQPAGTRLEAELHSCFAGQKRAFEADPDPPLAVRRDRLDRLLELTERNQDAIVAAIAADFGTRSSQETRLAEVFMVTVGIRHARRHLARWMRQRPAPTPLYLQPGRSYLLRQPLGVVGVISPWNYPFQLAILPVVAALAAGNRVLLKPSEFTLQTSALLARLVGAHFDSDELAVINGGPELGSAFAQMPLDHLFFTGSTAVGRKIALAAAANLTPVTLELGGKSPRLHATQTSPLLAPRVTATAQRGRLARPRLPCVSCRAIDALVQAIDASVRAMYPTLAQNPDYTSTSTTTTTPD
jgi:predicted DsbA family dithiol-disulfide isomerase